MEFTFGLLRMTNQLNLGHLQLGVNHFSNVLVHAGAVDIFVDHKLMDFPGNLDYFRFFFKSTFAISDQIIVE
jgi:hypothetical protein